MNIIANCCAGGEFYLKVLKTEFKNPFIWSSIAPDDMKKLIQHYDTLNFNNIEIKKDTTKLERFYILIDNKVKVHFPHYRFKAECEKPTTVKPNVFYNKIWELIAETWIRRLKKMTEEPMFMILTHRLYDEYTYSNCSDKDIQDFLNIDTKYKVIIMSPKELTSFKKNILCIKTDTIDHVKAILDNQQRILEFCKG